MNKTAAAAVMRACTLSMALAGSVALIAGTVLPEMAYADNGKGNGGGNGGGNSGGNGNDNSGGNGNGNGGGNGGGNGNGNNGAEKSSKSSGGSAASKSEKSEAKTAKASSVKKSKKKDLASELGVSASELGALNAAHASATALENAAPNSRVGRIAAYRDAVLEGRELEASLEDKIAEQEGLGDVRPLAEIETELATAKDTVEGLKADVTKLEEELLAAGGSDQTIEGLLQQAKDDLAAAEADQKALEEEQSAAIAYAKLDQEIKELEALLEDQPELERSLLKAAANKEVTNEVEEAVKKLLGL